MRQFLVSLLFLTRLSSSKLLGYHYDVEDEVSSRVSNVAPFHNPTEKYPYDSLPWPCRPESIKNDIALHKDYLKTQAHQKVGLGSVITGERNRESLYKINFLSQKQDVSVCGSKDLSSSDVNKFINAIKHEYQYEMWIDDLPLFGRVGFQSINEGTSKVEYFLITHRHFNIRYNHDQIITVNISKRLQADHFIELVPDTRIDTLDFTYSVSFSKSTINYTNRWKYQMHSNPTKYQIEAHWLWILNSSLLVILLTGLLGVILLRTLKNDVARYLNISDIEKGDLEQTDALLAEVDDRGWKRIQCDVFRCPPYPYLFSSIIGVGAQILMITIFLLLLAVVGYFYPGNHGRTQVAAMILYSFTAYAAGYIASSKLNEITVSLKKTNGNDWMRSCVATFCIFAVPFLMVFSVVNTVAAAHKSSMALPFATILAIVLLWAFLTLPLTAFGAFRGMAVVYTEKDFPCHVNVIERQLPLNLPWYHNHFLLVMMAGLLPFIAIYVEVHTIFISMWGHQSYTLFGILLLTFIILLVVTCFVVVLMTYFQLTAEDYRWWWSALARGSACGIFMLLYAIYYWSYSTHMSGSLQFTMYFGYSFVLAYALALMLAAVAHWASRAFVFKIYAAIKSQ